MRKLLRLFWEFFRISLCVVGGGYAILSVADEVFSRLGWTEEGELVEKLPVLQMVPGLIAGNSAIYVGNKVAGWPGALVALVAVAVPSFFIFLVISMGYGNIPLDNPHLNSAFVGLRAALTGIIAGVIWKNWTKSVSGVFGYVAVALCASILVSGRVNPFWVLLGSALCGISFTLSTKGKYACSVIPSIFFLFAMYGSVAFGGGYVLVPFYVADFVGSAAPYLQLAEDEFANIMALTQMTPGPISINCATFFGFRLGGVLGAGVATAALLLPGYFLLLAALRGLERFKNSKIASGMMVGLKPASMAMMICALISFAKFSNLGYNIISTILFLGVFALQIRKRKKMSPMITILASALLAMVAGAAEVSMERYPDADSVVLDQVERTRYNPDGSYEIDVEVYVKVLTEKGRREESELSVSYNRRYGYAEIKHLGIIGEDGEEKSIDFTKTMKEASDNSSMAENIYDSMAKKLTCTIPGIKIGDIVHVQYRRIMEKSRIENQFADMAITEWQCPILKTTIIVDAPKERPLKNIRIRHPLENHISETVEEKGDRIVYTWTTNYPAEQAFEDPNMPPMYTQVECVRYSTAENWQEISRWYWDTCAPHLAKTTASMTNTVEEVGRDIEKLYKWVAQEIRYMGLTMEDTSPGYAPHDVDITYNNRYGVCRDKAGLLVAMLRIAGFEAYPVLIHNGAKQDPDVPMPYFNHAIVCVKKDGEIILMDPTDESSRDILPSYLSDKSYLVATPEGDPLRTSPTISPLANSLVIDTQGVLEPSGSVLFEMKIDFNGINDNTFRSSLVRKTQAEQRNYMQRILRARYPGAELLKCDISPRDLQDTTHPLRAKMVVRIPDMVLGGETKDEITLPMFSRSFGVANWLLTGRTSLEKRKYPLVIDTTASAEEHIAIQTAGVLGEMAKLPDDVEIEAPYAYSQKFRFNGNELRLDAVTSIDKVEFTPEEYYAIREEQKRIEASQRERVMFGKNRTFDANLRYRYWSDETSFTGDNSWVVTNHCVMEILTYDGKKSNSELTFLFNPTWKNVEVVSACVSNRNGRVAWLDKEKEINVMDAAWASSAPRYPATKTMVVSLPSVEVGSVVSYTTVTTVTDAPVEFYDYWCFDSFDPVDELYVKCGDWERRVVYPKRLTVEQLLPEDRLWRDSVTISSNNFTRQCARLAPALDVKPLEFPEAGTTLEDIRNWMIRHIRLAGPGLYEVPLKYQLTDPETVIKERYANRLDYIRTMTAILRGAGYETDIVFATIDSGVSQATKDRNMYKYPNVGMFNQALARVKVDKTGWWKKVLTLGLCKREFDYFYLGLENEYTPIGATDYSYSHYFNPADDTFNTAYGLTKYDGYVKENTTLVVNEDASVDMSFVSETAGTGVGGLRKQYAEMLPEDKSRHYQQLLAKYSSAAKAIGELNVDTENYPAKLDFSCHIPDFTLVKDGSITVTLPDYYTQLFPLSEPARMNPIGIAAHGRRTTVYKVVFPEGYTVVERLPEAYKIADPQTGTGTWYENFVTTKMEDGRLVVYVWREEWSHVGTMLGKDFVGLLKDWSRIGSSRGNRTICIRKEQ